MQPLIFRNYLRVRGEYLVLGLNTLRTTELPPRARRIQEASGTEIEINGTTSACAENTTLTQHLTTIIRNYLRVRGEYPK